MWVVRHHEDVMLMFSPEKLVIPVLYVKQFCNKQSPRKIFINYRKIIKKVIIIIKKYRWHTLLTKWSYRFYIWELIKKFYLHPCNFLVVNDSVLKIGMNIHSTFTYTWEKLRIDTVTRFLYVTLEGKKDLVHRKWSFILKYLCANICAVV